MTKKNRPGLTFENLQSDWKALNAADPKISTPAERAELLTERHGAVYRDVVRRMGRDGWLGVGWPGRGSGSAPMCG